MGWSPLGTAFATVFLVPGLALLVWPPRRPIPQARVHVGVTVVERVGQAAVLAVLVLSPRELRGPATPVLWAAAVATFAYLVLWVFRYALNGREPGGLFEPLAGLPVPLALLPVVAFGLLAVWGHSWGLLAVVAVFGAAHVTVALDVREQLAEEPTATKALCRRRARRPPRSPSP